VLGAAALERPIRLTDLVTGMSNVSSFEFAIETMTGARNCASISAIAASALGRLSVTFLLNEVN